MPRYFFDIRAGEISTKGDTGLEFDHVEAAEREAVKALRKIAKDALPDGEQRDFVVNVRDEANRPVLRASLSFAVVRFV